jgi:type 1 fimbria pilin
MKNWLPAAVPSGVVTSITSSRVPAGTVAVRGTVKIVSCWSGMLIVPEVASNVRVPLGKGAPLSA